MNFTYWTGFSKRKNSTKVPTGAGTVKTCYLKDDTSVLNPTIKLDGHGYRNMSYAQISDFGRYYFIKDVREVGPQTHVELTVDPAASHKASITASEQYVERANTSGIIPRIADPLNPPTNDVELKSTDILDTGLGNLATPYYILGTVSGDGVSYYAMDNARLTLILGNVFNASFFQNWNNMFYGIKDCLISLKKVPYVPSGETDNVWFGQYNTQDTAKRIPPGSYKYKSSTVLVNRPSDDHEAGTSYLDSAPYSVGSIYLPYVGIVPLDMEIIGDSRYITVEMWLDEQTADIVYLLSTNGKRLASYSGNCGADMPVAAQHYNAIGAIAGALSVAGGIAMDNPALAISGALSMQKELSFQSQVNGVLSSFIAGHMSEWVVATVGTKAPISWDLDINKAVSGLPVFKKMTLSSISGYVQCRGAHVSIDGYDSERTEIESMLNNGLFIE